MDFYKPFMLIGNSYPFTDIQNPRAMEIRGTSDDSWCDLWNDIRITRIFLIELWKPQSTEQGQVKLHIQLQIIIITQSDKFTIRIVNIKTYYHLQHFLTTMSP